MVAAGLPVNKTLHGGNRPPFLVDDNYGCTVENFRNRRVP